MSFLAGSRVSRSAGLMAGAPWESGAPLPSQLERTSQLTPEHLLMLAVLEDALTRIRLGVRNPANATAVHSQREAERWVQSTEQDWLYAFESLCAHVGFEAEWLRKGIGTWIAAGCPTAPPKAAAPKPIPKAQRVREALQSGPLTQEELGLKLLGVVSWRDIWIALWGMERNGQVQRVPGRRWKLARVK